MMAQFLSIKERHQEYLLFYRMGDFYELFFDDAGYGGGGAGYYAYPSRAAFGEAVPMCGVCLIMRRSGYLQRFPHSRGI